MHRNWGCHIFSVPYLLSPGQLVEHKSSYFFSPFILPLSRLTATSTPYNVYSVSPSQQSDRWLRTVSSGIRLTSLKRNEQDNLNQSEDNLQSSPDASPKPQGGRKPAKLGQAMAKRPQQAQQMTKQAPPLDDDEEDDSPIAPAASRGRRIVPVHQSRIQDRPVKVGEKDSSLKIKIELDLEVEVEIYARIKGDITIGLM